MAWYQVRQPDARTITSPSGGPTAAWKPAATRPRAATPEGGGPGAGSEGTSFTTTTSGTPMGSGTELATDG